MRVALMTGNVLVVLVLAGCGGGTGSESVETSSGAPPHLTNLKQAFERQIRKENRVSTVACRDVSEPDVMASGEEWDCDVTTQAGDKLEVEALVSVSTGSYSILDCRTNPRQKYSQTPVGICKSIH